MKKQILTLMVSAAVFATSPAFGMDEDEVGGASPKANPTDQDSEKVKNAVEKYDQTIQHRLALHRRFIHEKINESDEGSLRGRLKFLEEFFPIQSQFQYTLKHTPSGRAQIINEEWATPYSESNKLLLKIKAESEIIRGLLILKERLNNVIQRRIILEGQTMLHLPNRDWCRMTPPPGSYLDDALRKAEEEERVIRKEQIEFQRIFRGEGA